MTTMNIALPETLKSYVAERTRTGGYNSVSEYVRELIRADQEATAKRQAWQEVGAKLREGLESGEAEPVTEEFWEDLRRRARGETPR